MLREQAELIHRISFAINAAVIASAFGLAYLLRSQYSPPLQHFQDYSWALLIILPVWLYLLNKYQLFSSLRYYSPLDLLGRITLVQFWGGVIVSSIFYFVARDTFSRGFLLTFVLISGLLLLIIHLSRRILLGLFRRSGYNYRQLLVVGTEESSRRFLELVREHADWGLRIVGFVPLSGASDQLDIHQCPLLGKIDDLVEICKQNPVDEVVFCLPGEKLRLAEEYLPAIEELGTTSRVVMASYEGLQAWRGWSLFHNELPVLTICNKSLDAQQLFLKRVLDLVGAAVGLVLLLVMLPFVALAIKLDSKGPVFFCQNRTGMNGRIFCCWKFRSMQVDAEERKLELLARNEMQGAIFKVSDDPRITRIGRFLRRSSIDEFPQFWNVLKGEMSLVGTRPPTPDEVDGYENWHRRRISIKPGITGMWQVSGRNQISDFDEIVRLDIRYIEQWNLWLDFKILLKTCWVLVARRGAC